MQTLADYQAYEVFLTAEAYRHAAEILRSGLPENLPPDFRYVIAANHALALELYLKSLIVMEKIRVGRHHRLSDHFKDLSIDSQDAIRKYYQEILKTDPHLLAEQATLKAAGKDPDKIFEFDNVIQESNMAFEYSRYPYEPRFKTHTYLAVPIEAATRRVIVDREPAWDRAFLNLLARHNILPTSQAR